mgnify:CR=1 FL=1
MQITDVRVRKVAKEGKMKAIVSLDGEYRDIAHPINSGTRDRIQRQILDAYEAVKDEPVEE